MRSRGVWSFMGATMVMAAWALAWAPVAGQARAASARKFEPPRLSDGKPDLQGIWQVRNTAYADLEDHPARLLGDKKSARLFYSAGLSVVEGREIPYRPEALATKRENFRNQETADPMAKCYLPGVPRVMYLPVPFQLFQTSRFITIVPEYTHSVRTIFVDGSTHLEDIQFWMGDSRGRWEGDTLVVDVTNFNGKTWLDMAGNFHSDALHVVERFTLVDADTIQYEAAMEDPNVFTRPWKIGMPISRVRPSERPEILEYECADLLSEAAGIQVNPSEEPPAR